MYWKRPNLSPSKYSMGNLLRCGIKDCKTIHMTTAAAAAALPQSAAAAVQEYTSGDIYQETVICSGTIIKTGDTYGVLFQDSLPSTDAVFVTAAPNLLFQCVAADVAGITAGVDMYIVDATKRVTWDSNAGANKFIGKCRQAVETDPTDLPAGKYVEIDFYQSEL